MQHTGAPGRAARKGAQDQPRSAFYGTFAYAYLRIHSHEVLGHIGRDSREWEAMVPPEVAAAIKQRRLFGFG